MNNNIPNGTKNEYLRVDVSEALPACEGAAFEAVRKVTEGLILLGNTRELLRTLWSQATYNKEGLLSR